MWELSITEMRFFVQLGISLKDGILDIGWKQEEAGLQVH